MDRQSIYTQSMAKLLEQMNRIEAIQNTESQRVQDDALTCKFDSRNSCGQPWFAGFSFSKNDNGNSSQTAAPIAMQEMPLEFIRPPPLTTEPALNLEVASVEDILSSFYNETPDIQPVSVPQQNPHKRMHSEIANEDDEILDGVKRVRFDQQFQELMQQKEHEQWTPQSAPPQMFSMDENWNHDISPNNNYRYLVRNSRARRKNNQPLPQDAYQMSFKFRA
jgi:hypothetical protein